MLRNQKQMSGSFLRRGNSPLTAVLTVSGMFTAVLITVLMFREGNKTDQSVVPPTLREDETLTTSPATGTSSSDSAAQLCQVSADPSSPTEPLTRPSHSGSADAVATKGGEQNRDSKNKTKGEEASPVSDAEKQRLQQVQAHLAAGEFGPALDIALNVPGRWEKSQLLRLIAAAQQKAGASEAALQTLRKIPVVKERTAAARQHLQQMTAGEQIDGARFNRLQRLIRVSENRRENRRPSGESRASAAGGSGADFTQLKNLIQNETSGPWFEVDGVGGTMTELETGVRVDPNGMLSLLTREEQTGRLKALGLRARRAQLNEDMARPSSLRLVSLTRLEQEIRRRLDNGEPVVETMRNLAGLYKVEYIFVYPETGEIVIGGPAEGWQYNAQGQPVGQNTGKPTLQLDDFVTVFRTFSPSGSGFFNCLIVPRKEGLKKARAVSEASQKRGPLPPGGIRHFVRQLTEALGAQDVKLNGVPIDSRVARVIVEADYRMKLIGIDKLQPLPQIPSYFDLLAKHPQNGAPALDALRWWLTMKYDAILHSKDRTVFHVRGSSVLCQGLNEIITPDGRRVHTGKADPVNHLFALNFTNHYAELAKRDLIFADLQNIFDLSLVAALIRHEGLDRRTNWDGGVFAEGGRYRPAVFDPPKTVPSVSNYRRYAGNNVVIQVAGGVRGDLMAVVKDERLRQESPRLGGLADFAKAPPLPAGRWWWDASPAK